MSSGHTWAAIASLLLATGRSAAAQPAPDIEPDAVVPFDAEYDAQTAETIEVHSEPPPSSPGAAVIDREELERIPGSGGDLVRTLTAMPGIVNTQLPTGFSGLVIRGSAPQDSKILIDGFEVPLLYHSLAFRAIVPTEAIDALEYIPGGFDVGHGRATSGIVALKTRAGSDTSSEQLELAVLDASGLVQGKLGKHTRYMLAVRRSTIDLLLPYVIPSSANLSLTTVPHYYDLQARVDHELSDSWRLTVSAIGSLDGFELFTSKTENADKRFFNETRFVRLTSSARWSDGPWSSTLALSVMPQELTFELGSVQHLDLSRLETTLRGEVTRTVERAAGLRDVVWRLGGEADVSRYHVDIALPTPQRNGITMMGPGRDPDDTSTMFNGVVWTPDFAAWTDVTASLDSNIRLTTGLRIDAFQRPGDVRVEPRGQLEIKLAKHTSARLAAGTYSRPPEYQDELLRDVHAESARQVIVGLEHQPREGIRLQGSLYYTDRSNLVTNDADGKIGNQGRGTSYGAELLTTLRSGPWFGWLSYSYSHSTRIDYPGASERLFEYDQPHSLNASLSWKRGAWQLGGRFELYSGLPYTPVIGSTLDSDRDFYTPIYGPTTSGRTPLHHQIDLRIDHTWKAGGVTLTGFLDVQNVYLNRSVTTYNYNYDYSQRFAFTSLPIIPSIGLRGAL